jgi:tetratricopeptide (TPR) repeat protein
MMREHPTREVLERFLCGRLTASEVKVVVVHLAKGCAKCRRTLAPLAEAMFDPGGDPQQLPPVADAFYESPVAAACVAVLGDWEPHTESRPWDEMEPAEALLETSRALRYDDPVGMLQLAALACAVAEGLKGRRDRRLLCDLRARAWGELANAFRASNDHTRAGFALCCAFDRRRNGSGDPLLLARLAELAAVLSCSRRSFPEAFRLLDLARALYTRYGDAHDVGRILVRKGLYLGRANDPESAIELLASALATIDVRRDPRLVFQTLHNLLLFRVELGSFGQAESQLAAMRRLYERYAGRIDQMKLTWIEGRIAAGLDQAEVAERIFLRARSEFDAAGLGYHAALISLDLAALQLEQGRTAEVRLLVEETVAAFRAVGVDREAIAALLMLREASEQDKASMELLRSVASVLQRLEAGPARRLELEAH